MKKQFVILAMTMCFALKSFSQGIWTWMSGEKSANVNRVYGTKGVESASANPGSRVGAANWTDQQGNLWLFGGKGNNGVIGSGALNDLWRYNTNTNQWAWMGGGQDLQGNGVYVGKGVSSPVNVPGARHNTVSWVDNNGNFWLFGGTGMTSYEVGEDEDLLQTLVSLNDLWRYSRATGQWTFVGGTVDANERGAFGDRGQASESFYPGARYSASGWKDNSGNLWLFGGRGYSSENRVDVLDEVWKYSPSDNTWAWMAGDDEGDADPSYGHKGVFAGGNTPGGRHGCLSFTDRNGNFWLYGGGTVVDLFSDLWRYDHVANRWAWVTGSELPNVQPEFSAMGVPDAEAHPGARTLSAVWVDEMNNAWIFGGNGYGGLLGSAPRNNLWKYSIASNEWSFVKGDNLNPSVVYGVKGEEDFLNTPGGMGNVSFWQRGDGSFWVFGGRRTATDYLNQVWRLGVGECDGEVAGNISPATASICASGSTVLTATGGTSYEWSLNGQKIEGQTGDTLTATLPGTYSAIIINGSCSGAASNTSIVTRATAPSGNISPATASICAGGSTVLTATGGTSYEWSLNGQKIEGQTGATITVTLPGTYSAVIINGSCTGAASNTSIVTRATAPSGNISPATASICAGGSTVLTATGGTSYEWSLNGQKIEGQTGATLTVTLPGTYSATIINGSCTGAASNTSVVTRATSPTGNITPATASICAGGSTVLTATGGTSYEWSLNGQKIEGQTGATITVTLPGTYSATIINGFCTGAASNTSEVTVIENKGIRYSDISATENIPFRMNARISGTTFQWTPSTGLDNASSAAPLTTLSTNQLFFVNITFEDGCSVVDTQFVNVKPISNTIDKGKVVVPSAFTPNGNNSNDILRPLGKLKKLEFFRIYNRWGILVFQTNKIGEGWDGRSKGVMQSQDTFSWILVGELLDGEIIKMSGKTVLIR